MRRLVVLGLAVLGLLLTAGAAQAAPYKLTNKLTGLALSVHGNVAAGSGLSVRSYTGSLSQKWTFAAKPGGHWVRNAANPGLCVVPSWSSGNLQLGACATAGTEAVLVLGTEPGGGRTIRRHSGLAPAVAFGGEDTHVYFDAQETGSVDLWHQWTFTDVAPPPPEGDPWPPVCNVKPSLPQCNP